MAIGEVRFNVGEASPLCFFSPAEVGQSKRMRLAKKKQSGTLRVPKKQSGGASPTSALETVAGARFLHIVPSGE
jgi:hypothetical protein